MAIYSALVIDDDVWMQRILSKTLQGFGFTDILLASNGFDGISLAVERKPTLIILDILMPELSGHQTLRVLKSIRMTKDMPVLMVSALSDTENLGIAIKSGTAGFISKPFTRATVYEKLIAIFGPEKLRRIAAGEPFDDIQDSYSNDILSQTSNLGEDIARTDFFESPTISVSVLPDDSEINLPKQNVSSDTVAKRYVEDDRRSIESIKQLLFKPKK